MSRFCFCNCPAGFSADPERHAPDCPGRSGAGKARTPVPATTPALAVSAAEELDAALHWRNKHALAIKERDALQQRLTKADERVDVLEGFLRDHVSIFKRGVSEIGFMSHASLHNRMECALEEIDAALNPADPAKDERVCPGCGTKGWTACCTQCVPY